MTKTNISNNSNNSNRPMVRPRSITMAGSGNQVCNHWGCGVLECYQVDADGDANMTATTTTTIMATPIPEDKPIISPPTSPPISSSHRHTRQSSVVSLSSNPDSNTSIQDHDSFPIAESSSSFNNASAASAAVVPSQLLTNTSNHSNASSSLGEGEPDIDCSESSSSSYTSCSVEFKTHQSQVTLIDNAGNIGIYTGTIDRRTGKPHGEGTMVYQQPQLQPQQPQQDDDDTKAVVVRYEGQWVHGDWSGFGRLSDGSTTYQGGFLDNRKHGLGVMITTTNTPKDNNDKDNNDSDANIIYEGTFQLDRLEGNVHVTYPDGTKYWGSLNDNGIPHGRGKKTFTDGRIFDGEFDNDVLQGHGRMTYPDGRWYLGEWSDGTRNGLGLEVLQNGTVQFEGMYSNGRPTSSSSFPHTQLSSGRFLLYRSSQTQCQGTLVGPLPEQVYMQKKIMMRFGL